MQLQPRPLTLPFSLFLPLLLFLSFSFLSQAHNVTRLLAKHPSLSTLNHYLSETHLADEINHRTTITVLALDNSAIAPLSSLPLHTLKNVLSIHILLDYFGAKKLHQIRDGSALAATLFQATGSAPGTTGFVNISDLRGGKVAFGAKGGDLSSFFVKSVEEVPYNISIVQISRAIPSDTAAAPAPEPSEVNLTAVMSAHGCKVFAETLLAHPDAAKTYQDGLEGGLTVYCPGDEAMKGFLPKFKNLTAAEKVSYLEFLAVPIYNSMRMLKSNNGPMNTLATDGARKFDFDVQNDGQDVTLKTKVNTVKIVDTLIDEQPLAIYATDKVLLPSELFKPTLAPAPAPAPEDEAADSPKPSKSKKKKKAAAAPKSDGYDSDAPADAPDADAADQTADESAGARISSKGAAVVASLVLAWCLGLRLL